ncbi:type IV pilin protein [Sansalvadorimonas verongulae]|uniref:type IV pilin protein n=1 Tax=Sansalvadorimonas verongulae TaxID=2172824 RepID=UPI0012BD6FDD|nr:type IV pilin protein [Sansalvadorimonas verongulae]MTI13465.1 prepilin-type N-terminal cleavage/methylation domain-containing protein [Sansalvadorimonas verongulae]
MTEVKVVRPFKGFTLFEILIVLAIVSILMSIAYPSYRDYIVRASRSDAHVAIQKVAMAEERIYAVSSQYTGNMDSLGGRESPEGLYELAAVTGIWSGTNCALAVNDTTATNSYTILATPTAGKSQENDSDCTCIYFDSRGVKGSTGGRANAQDCW